MANTAPIFYTVLNPDRTIKYSMFTTDGKYQPTNGEILVKDIIPEYNEKYQSIVRLDPVPEGDSVVYEITTMTDEEKLEVDSDEARSIRNVRLEETDFIMFTDSPFTDEQKAQWAIYRQELRDVTNQDGFPSDITWPVRPGS